jgi:glycosyltransferase involved in cell wall biosynthesis
VTNRRILHVGFDVGSGVLAVIADHMAATPDDEHQVAVVLDESCPVAGWSERAASVELLPRGPSVVGALRAQVRAVDPDVVHAHSSFAGALTRTVLPAPWRHRVVYTPHCYAFRRSDIGPVSRFAYWAIEAALARRTAAVAAVSRPEAATADALGGHARVTHVPNVARGCPILEARPLPRRDQPLRIVTAGRITPAKDPAFFAAAAARREELPRPTAWTWVGGGSDDDVAFQEAAGVEVTGWVDRSESLRRMTQADVYVHTAAWEGCPMTVLEAAALAVPIVGRRIPALEALGVRPLVDDVVGLLATLATFPDADLAHDVRSTMTAIRASNAEAEQARALDEVYAAVAGRPAEVRVA